MLAQPRDVSFSAQWHPVGPLQIGSLAYGNITGRITSIAVDPADSTGNTVYIGTTGAGVWKSTNAAGAPSGVSFIPLTDTLPVFSATSGSATIPSLSIGALSVAKGVVLAGTGDPNDALDSYYGSGLLRSADGGATWTLIQESHDGVNGNHTFFGLGFAGLAWSSVTPLVAVAAVSDAIEGEVVNATDANYSVRGLYYSTDAGVTWQMATIKDGSQTVQSPQPAGLNAGGNAATSVVWNPVRQRFYAAVRYHGYYESADGSVWTRLASQPGTGLTTLACPTDPGTMGSISCPIFRGTLAVEPVSGDTFAFTVDAKNLDQGIWRDQCNLAGSACSIVPAAFGLRLNSTPLEQGGGGTEIPQGDYNLSLAAVNSGTDTLVFAGTVDLYRCSLADGCSFRNTTNTENGCSAPAMVAPAQHAIVSLFAGTSSLLYLGNDGGLWRSTDGVNQQASPCSADDASHFQNLNGGLGSLAEVVNFSQHPSDAATLLVGVGANGTAATSTASLATPWQQLAAGEGGFTAIDPATPANWYISTAPGVGISYCGKAMACSASDFAGAPAIGPPQVGGDFSLIDAPWLLDPALSSDIVIGTCRVWRGPAESGSGWGSANALSADFGTGSASCGSTNSYVRSIAAGGPVSGALPAANAGSEVLYAGLAGTLDGGGSLGGHLFSTSAANTSGPSTAWADLALSPVTNDASDAGVFNPGGFDISSIAVDPHDPIGATVYATVAGFAGNGINAPHLYRSIDSGDHWINISSNLPNAPANSVVVDPNDANTLYVALDTGVYATSSVTSCTTANCWSILGSALPNAPVVQLAASVLLPAGAGTVGMLRAATYGRGIWEIPLLTAATPLSAQIVMTPNSLSFPAQPVGTASSAQTITLINSGTAPLIVSSLTVTGSFQETDNCAGSPVAVGASCAVQIVFFAASPGTTSGLLTVYANVAGGQATAALSGLGAAPASVVLTPLSVDFGLVTVNQTASAQSITVSNTGGSTATVRPPTVSGDFSITSNTCEAALAPGVSCSVAIAFSPVGTGTRNGVFTLADSAGTQNASLTGRGASIATDTLSPALLGFPGQLVGTVSAANTVTLTDSGDTALSLITAMITSGDFIVVNECGSSLSGHSACTLQVAFAPQSAGAQTGALTLSDQFRTQTVALSGTGFGPPTVHLSPNTLSFAGTSVGQSAPTQTLTITNSGDGTLAIASIATSGDFTEADNCAGKALSNSGTSCVATIGFSPSAIGARSGVLTVTGSAAGQIATASLIGAGLGASTLVLSPTSLNFGTITLGSPSAAQNVTISNTGGVAATLQTITTAGDFTITANTCGLMLAPSTGCTVAVLFTPTVNDLRNGVLSIAGSAGTLTVPLTGRGASVATDGLTPLALSYPVQSVGTASAPQTVTLTNTGDNALSLIAVAVSGGNFTAASACGPTLAGHSSCTIAVTSTPVINGLTSGVMTVSDQFRSQTVSLSGSGIAPPDVQLTPASLNFPDTATGHSSISQMVQISDFGIGSITVTSVAVSGDFAEADSCAGKVLSGAASCAVQVTFSPAVTGQRFGLLTVFASTPGSGLALQKMAALTGNGAGPAVIVLDPASASFGTVTLGESSRPAQNITISNTGGVAATLSTPNISGDFSLAANTCGATLPPSTGCTVAIIFTPLATGTRSGTLSITDSAGTQKATLTGIGAASATDTLSPLALTFAPQQILTASAPQRVSYTNNGDNPLTLIAAVVSGGSFAMTNNCGPSLAGHSTCTFAVASTPLVVGTTTGTLTVSNQFRSQTVALSGTGLAPPGVSLSPPAGLTFLPTGVGQTSALQTVTLSNEDSAPLSIRGMTTDGDFSISTAGNTCGTTVAAFSACTFQVVFTPSVDGARSGSLTVDDNAAGSPQTLSLAGVGIDFALNSDGPANITIASGASAAFPLILSSTAGTPGTAILTCTGAPANSTCVVVPASVSLGATVTLTATVKTGVTVGALSLPVDPATQYPRQAWWALALPLGIALSAFRRRQRNGRSFILNLLSLAWIAALLCATGCGSGRLIPGAAQAGPTPTPVATPSGTYSIVVAASSSGLTRSVTLTLVVQ